MKYLEVGVIVTTHGIKGEVKVKIITDDISRFDVGETLFLGAKRQKIIINSSRMHQNMMLITFNNLDNINDVLDYVGMKLYCDIDLYERSEDEYYYDDLIDCQILVDKQVVGIVNDIMEVPQGIILMITKDNGEEKLIPFVDEFIGEVNLKAKTIEVFPIEGLL